MLLNERHVRPVHRADTAGSGSTPAPVPPRRLLELLRELFEREHTQRQYRPARVYLPGRTIHGSALLLPNGWISVYDDGIEQGLTTQIQRCRVAAMRAREAGHREVAADRDREAQALQAQLDAREAVVSESFPPAMVRGVEWLVDDEPASALEFFSEEIN